ncbi:casein kinase subunit II beta [Mycena olivaceomarginata]|nr:casein kinase subunit II beta [Mycena olivaceomarginata]
MGSDSDYSMSWVSWFLSSKGNEYFCEVDEDFILDRFNLTGLNTEALNLIMDRLELSVDDDEPRESLNVQARLLYGLIHARWIVTAGGLTKMVEKYKCGVFGRCPRVLCHSQSLLPVGLVDVPFENTVKLYCGRCQDIYSPKSSRHGSIDGAARRSRISCISCTPRSFRRRRARPQIGPQAWGVSEGQGWDWETDVTGIGGIGDGISTASVALGVERYRPRIYGFQLNETAKLQRWQEAARDRQVARLEEFEAQA